MTGRKKKTSYRGNAVITASGMPLRRMLEHHLAQEQACFHMPGHLGGEGVDPWLLRNAFRVDVTELPDTDDLHHPGEAIGTLHAHFAKCWGAGRSRMLVNGSTSGLHAIMRMLSARGGLVIAGRDCHQSVWAGAMMAGLDLAFIACGADPDGMPAPADASDVEIAVRHHPGAVAVVVTSPNYYGRCADLRRIAKIVHDAGMALVVDEAHGAHFPFHPSLPAPALACGADLVVQSLHKTLPALTQSAVVHASAESPVLEQSDLDRLDRCLAMMQTSSPSFLLMASMESALAQTEAFGKSGFDQLFDRIERLREDLEAGLSPVRLLHVAFVCDDEARARPETGSINRPLTDPTRIVLHAGDRFGSGTALAAHLRERGIQPEMADPFRVVLISTPWHADSAFALLADAIACWKPEATVAASPPVVEKREFHGELDACGRIAADVTIGDGTTRDCRAGFDAGVENAALPTERLQAAAMRRAIEGDRIELPLDRCSGRISANAITPYPPGIPLVMPGERLTLALLNHIRALALAGVRINGLEDGRLAVSEPSDI